MQQLVGDDRVEHAHAAFVEDAEDRLFLAQPRAEVAPDAFVFRGQLEPRKIAHVRLSCVTVPVREPFAQAGLEEGVGEVLAPERGIATPALVSEPLRLSMPTGPAMPLQLATVRIGPRCVVSPRGRDASIARPPRRR